MKKMALVLAVCGAMYAQMTEWEAYIAKDREKLVAPFEKTAEQNQQYLDTLVKDINEAANGKGKKARDTKNILEIRRVKTLKAIEGNITYGADLAESNLKSLLAHTGTSVEFRQVIAALRGRVLAVLEKYNGMKKQLEVSVARTRSSATIAKEE